MVTARSRLAITAASTLVVVLTLSAFSSITPGADGQAPKAAVNPNLEFIDTSFENASPLWYDVAADGVIAIHLNYDHERSAPNRAAGHIHFRVQGTAGARLTLEFKNLDNIYNGRPGSVAGELKAVVVSTDGRSWQPVATRGLPGNRVLLDVEMPGPVLHIARVEPYRLSDLEKWLTSIKTHALVEITSIGKTAESRPLEIVRVGDPAAPYRVFVRARAHPWEAGGNWVAQGLVERLLKNDDDARSYLKHYCVYLMPMANKDGVARGRTRFNVHGMDLNRNWDKPADPKYAPENDALELWLKKMVAQGQRPDFALELHNDGNGKVHISQPPPLYTGRYLERMQTFESLLRKHTWFTEGVTRPAANVGTLASGWLERYGIDAVVHEFNCHWIAGLKEHPTRRHWERYGQDLARVLYEYFHR